LIGLTILCIEKDMIEHTDVDTIINNFIFKFFSRNCIEWAFGY